MRLCVRYFLRQRAVHLQPIDGAVESLGRALKKGPLNRPVASSAGEV